MNYWLDLFTPFTWRRFQEAGASISGFRPRQRKTAFERVKQGDIFLCYLVKLSRWCGTLEVVSTAFEGDDPIFSDANDPFTIRFRVKPGVLLDYEQAIPIQEEALWKSLSFTRDIPMGAFGWAQTAGLRQSLVPIRSEDGNLLKGLLEQQSIERKIFPLDAADRRHITEPTTVRTERGEVAVEVPSREDDAAGQEASSAPDIRASIKYQAKIAKLGVELGFSVWIPPADRAKVMEAIPGLPADKIAKILPLNYDNATLKTIENIDVIWLDKRSIARAFEIEHTTSIFSGLLRMADLLAMQPRMNIALHIVAPLERRDQVAREIARPVFSVLEGGAMAEKCSFLSYEEVDKILGQPNLTHMKESIIEEYEEFFDI